MDLVSLGYAFALLAFGLLLLVAEFFIVSMGALAIGAFACGAGAIYFAFAASDIIGWSFVVLVPLLAAFVVRWGIERVQRSALVPQAAISAEAGYHHVADRVGASVGAHGVMITPALPSGRARFSEGECDVQSRGTALSRDQAVIVVEIDGPMVFVEPAEPVAASQLE